MATVTNVFLRESYHTMEQAIAYDETMTEQLENQREAYDTKVTL